MDDYKGPNGTIYKLGHFKPTNYQIGIKLNDTRYLVPLVITYSSHCFTDTKRKTVVEADPWFYNKDHTGPRAFCDKRWQSSLDLPENIDFLINQNKGCFDATVHGSYLHLRNPAAKYPGNGWYVMFKLSQADQPALVHMKIASHHFRKQLPDNVKNPKPKPFSMVLHQWITSKPGIVAMLESGQVLGSIIVEQTDAKNDP